MTSGFTPRPVSADAVIINDDGALLLIERRDPPFAGHFALPGGMVDPGESVEQGCCREVLEEVGLTISENDLQLVGLYSNPARDPRGTVTAAYLVHYRGAPPKPGDDATSAAFYADWQSKPFAFDHATIISDAMKLLRKAA